MNLKRRTFGLVATVGLLGGMFGATAPAARAFVVGGCSGLQSLGRFIPPLPSGGTPTAVVAVRRHVPAGTEVWGAGFAFSQTVDAGTCTILAPTFTDVTTDARLSGVASCDPTSVSPLLYPLNGTLNLTYAAGTLSSHAYIRIAGFNPVPGPDVVTITGMVTKGGGVGATISGDVFFDPVIRAVLHDPSGIGQGDYYFDNSQLVLPCALGGNSYDRFYLGDGTSLLGSIATGLTFNF